MCLLVLKRVVIIQVERYIILKICMANCFFKKEVADKAECGYQDAIFSGTSAKIEANGVFILLFRNLIKAHGRCYWH